jgi:hypothetical protein
VKEAQDEKDAGVYYEGPEPPLRYAEQVKAFAAMNAGATVEDWAAFCTRMAHRVYREGYTRGKEWRERDPDAIGSVPDLRDDWMWNSPVEPDEDAMKAPVQGEFLEDVDDENKARYLDAIGRYHGTFRIVVSKAK